MNPQLNGIWEHMRELGLCALAHANRQAAYLDSENGALGELSILQAAHAAEILIKARIAQEHPLLIFESFPKASGDIISMESLFEKGKTIEWSDLPDRLWAATGIMLPEIELYKQFGKLRNGIQHFSPPPAAIDTSEMTLQFVFGIIDPFINQCWHLFAIDYDEDYEPYVYFVSRLVSREILFLVSKDAAECYEDWDVDWTNASESYRDEMQLRIKKALYK